MKKYFVLLVLLLIISFTAYAKPGDIAGVYYVTDISGIVNGATIETKNIGGYTVINAEMMKYYGFDVIWNGEERTLRIDSVEHAMNGAPPTIKNSNVFSGNFGGYYYETDIVTYLDGEPITAYNIGGKTYILAEEMRDFGYVVDWVENDRCLWITSPYFAGYHYKLKLNEAVPQNTEGTGAFSVKYTKDGVTGTGDAEYLDCTVNSSGKGYEFILEFNQGYSDKLISLIKELSSGGNAYPIHNEELKYDLVCENVNITINGQRAKQIAVSTYYGKGNTTCYLYVRDIPSYTKDGIEELYISVGDTDGAEAIDIEFPEQELPVERIADTLKKYELDWRGIFYETDEYYAIEMYESRWLGKVTSRLYIVDKATGEVSEDILEQVRQYEGFEADEFGYGILKLYAMEVKDVKNNLFFSCMTKSKTGDFYVELDSGTVHFLAQSEINEGE